MLRTDPAVFRRLCGLGNVVPVCREIPADCLTPVLAWLGAGHRAERSFLLESVEGGERIARYSFMGRSPYHVIAARGRDLTEWRGRRRSHGRGDFLDRLRELFAPLRPVTVDGLPPFTGGAVGYLSYDAVRLFERIGKGHGSDRRPVAGGHPDAWFGLYDTVLAFDHLRQTILLIASAMPGGPGAGQRGVSRQYADAVARLDRLAADVARGARRFTASGGTGGRGRARAGGVRSNVTPEGFAAMVREAKERIRAGDIYQVVLSQRFRRALKTDPFDVYRSLRRINPSPYMYYLRDGSTALAGASPEMLVRVQGRRVEVHPIAGTRPRGETPERDAALEAELRADGKERAEHVMLVDLGRNDLGRVCDSGSVQVTDLMTVERYSHVMHLVSRVTGRLAEGRDAFDALRSVFPAGTVTGAPKVRAMEIIDELETVPRGPYAGAVCYVDHSGNLDSCIIIRTMVARGRTAFVQAGGGIVADSDPRREYQETVSKARAVLSALDGD